jgi:hypothetical protein
VVKAKPRPLYTLEETQYISYRRQCEPHDQSGRVRKISLPPKFGPRPVQPVASRSNNNDLGEETRNQNNYIKTCYWDKKELGPRPTI